MPIGWYILITIVLMGFSFYLGERYGSKEVKKLESQVSTYRTVISTYPAEVRTKVMDEISQINKDIQNGVKDFGSKL